MKHSFTTHNEIAREFINGKFDGRAKYSRNASTDGEFYVSYATTIARKLGAGRYVAIDSYNYSHTTAKQMREIQCAASAANLDTFRVPDIHNLAAPCNVEYYTREIAGINAKLRRARSERSKAALFRGLRDLLAGWQALRACCAAEGIEIAPITL